MEQIGDRILYIRKELGLSQEAFGSKIGIKKSSMSQLKRIKVILVNKRLNLFVRNLMLIILG